MVGRRSPLEEVVLSNYTYIKKNPTRDVLDKNTLILKSVLDNSEKK